MAHKNTMSPHTTPNMLVHRHLSDAWHIIKAIYDHLGAIDRLDQNWSIIEQLLTNLNDLLALGDLVDRLDDLDLLLQNLDNLLALINGSAIDDLISHLPELLEIYNNLNSLKLPAGGTTGQVLAKKSNTDRDVEWITVSAGSEGTNILTDLLPGTATANQFAQVNAIGTGVKGTSQKDINVTGFGTGTASANQWLAVSNNGLDVIGRGAPSISEINIGGAGSNRVVVVNNAGTELTTIDPSALGSGSGGSGDGRILDLLDYLDNNIAWLVSQDNPTLSGALTEGEVSDMSGYYGSGPSNGDLIVVMYSENNSEGFYIYNDSGPWGKAISDNELEARTWIFYPYNEKLLRSDGPDYSQMLAMFNNFNEKYIVFSNFKDGKIQDEISLTKANMSGGGGEDPYPYVYLFGI